MLLSNGWFPLHCFTAEGDQQHERTTNISGVRKTTFTRTASKVRLRECASSALKIKSEVDWPPQKCCLSFWAFREKTQDKHISHWKTREICAAFGMFKTFAVLIFTRTEEEKRDWIQVCFSSSYHRFSYLWTITLLLTLLRFCSLSPRRSRPLYRDRNRWRASVCSTARFGRRTSLLQTLRLV